MVKKITWVFGWVYWNLHALFATMIMVTGGWIGSYTFVRIGCNEYLAACETYFWFCKKCGVEENSKYRTYYETVKNGMSDL